MTNLQLSEQDLGKIFLLVLLASLLFGLSGLVGMLVMLWVTRQQYAQEDSDKHGISELNASRMGGVVIIGLALTFLVAHYVVGHIFSEVGPLGIQVWGWTAFLLCFLLGLVEDLNNDMLSPRSRLIILVSIFALVFVVWPEIIPNNLGYSPLDRLMSHPLLGWLLSVIFCAGFINAINMADGANGLVPGIVFLSCLIFHSVIGTFVWEVLLIVSGVFLMFNVASGRLFLGDAGSYGLGAILVLGGFYAVNTSWVSVGFAAVMMSYPCIELLVSILRRGLTGRSIFKPDNFHLHNYIYQRLKAKSQSKVLVNSATGLIIASGSAGVAYLGIYMNWLSPIDDAWGWVFAVQCVVYLICYAFLSRDSAEF
jgi:UDP-N-acetylmuramyl pentapeptide phosphotransferase/UDP-N-acetylglucosamine-1-phosphate transferase